MRQKKTPIRKVKKYLVTLLALFFAFPIVWVFTYRYVNPTLNSNDEPTKSKQKWVSYQQISIYLKQSVVVAEDITFLFHRGFDYKAIKHAYRINKEKGKVIYGASTISQQTAKNVFLWKERSWLRKVLEVYFTFLVEVFWSKQRILEVYLNTIELGENIYGIDAAVHFYFHKDSSEISLNEAAFLAAIIPNPRILSISFPNQYVIKQGRNIKARTFRFVDYIDML